MDKTAAQAQAYVQQLLANTVVQGTSAAVEFQDFFADEGSNKGDVFLDYEDDAIQAKRANGGISYVIPKQTILIENPIAVTTNSSNSAAANAFVKLPVVVGRPKEVGQARLPPGAPSGGVCDDERLSRTQLSCSRSSRSADGTRSRTSSSPQRRARSGSSPRSRPTSARPRDTNITVNRRRCDEPRH